MTRVLIVDDDPMVCTAIEIYLDRHGFEVTIADGGEAGLRALEDASFDLMRQIKQTVDPHHLLNPGKIFD